MLTTLNRPRVIGDHTLIGWLAHLWDYLTNKTTTLSAEYTLSGTTYDVTDVPPWAREISILFVGVSSDAGSNYIIQLGDSGGIETTGYLGSTSNLPDAAAIQASSPTNGFGIRIGAASAVVHGTVTLYLQNAENNTWVASGVTARSDTASTQTTAGSKSLSGALTQIRFTSASGTANWDAGTISIRYKR